MKKSLAEKALVNIWEYRGPELSYDNVLVPKNIYKQLSKKKAGNNKRKKKTAEELRMEEEERLRNRSCIRKCCEI